MAIIDQIRVGLDNFSYVISCPITNKAAIIDPGYDAHKPLEIISFNNWELKFIINTHYHSDHSSGNKRVKNLHPSAKIVISKIDDLKSGTEADLTVSDNDRLSWKAHKHGYNM